MDALISALQSDPNVANAFGALASAAAAILALLVSVISVVVSVRALRSQQRHNELSVRPLAEITVDDYEDSMRVGLRNNGTGPMIIVEVVVSDGAKKEQTVLDWMPSLPGGRLWNNFSYDLRDRTLQPGGDIVLIELTEHSKEYDFAKSRDLVREALAPLSVEVHCTDIYGNVMPVRKKNLSWFGRHK